MSAEDCVFLQRIVSSWESLLSFLLVLTTSLIVSVPPPTPSYSLVVCVYTPLLRIGILGRLVCQSDGVTRSSDQGRCLLQNYVLSPHNLCKKIKVPVYITQQCCVTPTPTHMHRITTHLCRTYRPIGSNARQPFFRAKITLFSVPAIRNHFCYHFSPPAAS